jgi:hypothetical protein
MANVKRLMVAGALVIGALVVMGQPVKTTRGASPLPTPTNLPSVLATPTVIPVPTGTVEPTAIKLLYLRATSH